MRIKFNASAVEVEVLDRNGERVYYVKTEGQTGELDARTLMLELFALKTEANAMANFSIDD